MEILKRDIRETIVSGLFYPEEPRELARRVEKELEQQKNHRGAARIILTPHGSWDQCAECIAAAFSAARDFKPRRILLIAPVHREREEQKIYLPTKKFFDSPLGLLPVDQKSCGILKQEEGLFTVDDSPHMEEHALELQLPFIQTLFPDTPLIPLLTAGLKRSNIKKGAALIRSFLKEQEGNTLIILSANLSRYGRMEETEKEAGTLLEDLNFPLKNSMLEKEKKGDVSSCGVVPLHLVSDLNLFSDREKGLFNLLHRSRTEVEDKNGTMAVHYAAGVWTGH
ncbi:MAG: AmmeMemoRadiSam system protein B [Spirochaetales bacterium]|nr:AmmeMemoRadiSam system protein B [Spirochaetales bacterium]